MSKDTYSSISSGTIYTPSTNNPTLGSQGGYVEYDVVQTGHVGDNVHH